MLQAHILLLILLLLVKCLVGMDTSYILQECSDSRQHVLSLSTCIYTQRVHVQHKRPVVQACLALLFFES